MRSTPKAGKPEPYLATPVVEVEAEFSPEGRWMAYASSESGPEEIFVRPFPDTGGEWKISTAGGRSPRWSRTSRELLFLGGGDRIQVAQHTTEGDSLLAGKPRVWADRKTAPSDVHPSYDLARTGNRGASGMSCGGGLRSRSSVTGSADAAGAIRPRVAGRRVTGARIGVVSKQVLRKVLTALQTEISVRGLAMALDGARFRRAGERQPPHLYEIGNFRNSQSATAWSAGETVPSEAGPSGDRSL